MDGKPLNGAIHRGKSLVKFFVKPSIVEGAEAIEVSGYIRYELRKRYSGSRQIKLKNWNNQIVWDFKLSKDFEDRDLVVILKPKTMPTSYKSALGNLFGVFIGFDEKDDQSIGQCFVVRTPYESDELSDIIREIENLPENNLHINPTVWILVGGAITLAVFFCICILCVRIRNFIARKNFKQYTITPNPEVRSPPTEEIGSPRNRRTDQFAGETNNGNVSQSGTESKEDQEPLNEQVESNNTSKHDYSSEKMSEVRTEAHDIPNNEL